MFEFFKNLDRRWVFLMMGFAVIVPILVQVKFTETPTNLARAVFNEFEKLEPGDKVLLSFDYDPASQGELQPMATLFVRHACEKKLKLYFMALWPLGPQMIDDTVRNVILEEYNEREGVTPLVYGEDYVNLGFKSGAEGVIKVVVTNMRQLYTTDSRGTAIDDIPMMDGVKNIRQMDLMANVSAGGGGTKEWVQYAVTPYPDDITLVAGCTGVQAPLLYPYIPQQLPGLLGAIKGAAEYEALVNEKYNPPVPDDPKEAAKWQTRYERYTEGVRRMSPQLFGHLLIILLIVAANVIYFVEKKREGSS
ncbi:MAG: hypothetical protein KAS72_00130 [Phycisphaerales bacterium]|nr:hypothetical protein [Phycisphaerales bacterium]